MQNSKKSPPVVLVIAGHDPSGGAGIQADIESISPLGCQVVSVITALSAQNTRQFQRLYPQNPAEFCKQLTTLLQDISVDACKIGLIGSLEISQTLPQILNSLAVPVVLDPVFRAGTGRDLLARQQYKKSMQILFGCTTLITPNILEATVLTGRSEPAQAAAELLNNGLPAALITGSHAPTDAVENHLYLADGSYHHYRFTRLPHTYHGSGCTLSAKLAAYLALGENIITAARKAQKYTWQSLQQAQQIGAGQWHPKRWPVNTL